MPTSNSTPATSHAFERVTIELGARSYDIVIGPGVLKQVDAWPHLTRSATAVIVSNATVARHHLAPLKASLAQRHDHCIAVELPDGEQHKVWSSVDAITTAMLQHGCDRRTVVYALGGGVIGDVAGFAAACYMRGVPLVQVPTTLLAQVDSSVGGKTAINHALGKNMIGAFHQPCAVLCDLDTLATLPDREYRSGLGEVIKYGAMADAAFLGWLEVNMPALLRRDPTALAWAVRRSCELKAAIVAADEREGGVRATLNFGHTFAHAIEAEAGYGAWLHGEAVACGMVLAAALSVRLGLIDQTLAARIRTLVRQAGLPVAPPAMAWSAWLHWMRVDKKAEHGDIRYIVLDGAGRASMRPVDDALVADVIAACPAS